MAGKSEDRRQFPDNSWSFLRGDARDETCVRRCPVQGYRELRWGSGGGRRDYCSTKVQGDPAPCSKPPVDIDLKLRFSIRTFYLNATFTSMSTGRWCVTLYTSCYRYLLGRITTLPSKMERTLTLERCHPPSGFQNQMKDPGKGMRTFCKTELQLVLEQRLSDDGGRGEPKLIKLPSVEIEASSGVYTGCSIRLVAIYCWHQN